MNAHFAGGARMHITLRQFPIFPLKVSSNSMHMVLEKPSILRTLKIRYLSISSNRRNDTIFLRLYMKKQETIQLSIFLNYATEIRK